MMKLKIIIPVILTCITLIGIITGKISQAYNHFAKTQYVDSKLQTVNERFEELRTLIALTQKESKTGYLDAQLNFLQNRMWDIEAKYRKRPNQSWEEVDIVKYRQYKLQHDKLLKQFEQITAPEKEVN